MVPAHELGTVSWQTYNKSGKGKCTANPIQACGFQEVEAPRFQDNRHVKVRLLALRTGRLYYPGNIPGTHFCWRLSQLQGHSADGRIMLRGDSNTSSGIETTTSRLVAQCLKRFRQRVPHNQSGEY